MKPAPNSVWLAVLFLLFSISLTSPCAAQVQYAIKDLGTLGGTYSAAYAINNNGQIVGTASASDGSNHAFLYGGSGPMQDLSALVGSSFNVATSVNESGQIVGYGEEGALLYTGSGPIQSLRTLNDAFFFATGINNKGQVVGGPGFQRVDRGSYCGYEPALLYNGGSVQELGTLGGFGSLVHGINDSGNAVGWSVIPGNGWHAVLFGGGHVQNLGTLSGGQENCALAINNNGSIVGFASTATGPHHAFLFNGDGPMQDLGTLYGTSASSAAAVNSLGQVVGACWGDYGANERAFIYNGSGPMRNLNDFLIAPSSGWTLIRAEANNDRGQIVGSGMNPAGEEHAFLLTPVLSKFSANDPAWKNLPYAGTTATIGGKNGKGCLLTSLAMALTDVGIAEDPGLLNSLMVAGGGYNKEGYIDMGTAVKTAARAAGLADKVSLQKGDATEKRSSSTEALDKMLSHGHPVIVAVSPTENSQGYTQWGHFVVVTSKQDSNYTIYDPADRGTTLDTYSNVFETRGYVEDPPDVSEIDLSVVAPGSGVNILLTDSHGNKTGIDGAGGRFELVPDSVHFIDAIVGLESNEQPTHVSQYIFVQHPELGDYGIEISAIDATATSYSLMATAFAPDGNLLWHREISGVISPGTVDQYSFTYAVPEPSAIILLSIGAASLLGYGWRRQQRRAVKAG